MTDKKEGEVKWIDIDDIKIDEMQSRMGHWKEDEQDKKLVNSMEGVGQIQDVIVRPLDNAPHTEKYKYGLVAGSRRYHAAIKAGLPKVRAIVREMDDEEALFTSISENLGHKSLTHYEKTVAIWRLYRLLRDEKGMGKLDAQKKIAKKLYGKEDRDRDIWKYLATMDKIPSQVLVLLKEPSERTPAEEKLLKKYSIPLDYSFGKELVDTVASLAGQIEEDKTDKILKVVSESRLWNMTEREGRHYIRDVRDMIEEGKPFDVVMSWVKGEDEDKFGIRHSYHLPDFHLPSKRYWSYHRKAIETYRKDEKELVRDVYVQWLDEQAEEKGWT